MKEIQHGYSDDVERRITVGLALAAGATLVLLVKGRVDI
jgi:hypothetical protein